jgi:hypothetical protein
MSPVKCRTARPEHLRSGRGDSPRCHRWEASRQSRSGRLDRGRGLGNASRDAFAGSAGAIVLRASAVDQAALVDAGGGLMRLWLEATRDGLGIHPSGSPFLFQRLLEDGDSLEGGSGPR